MGRVVVNLRILPEDVETPLDELAEEIEKSLPSEIYRVLKVEREPIAFGLEALRMYVSMPEDYEGGTSELEDLISGVGGVSRVEVLTVGRLL